MSIPHEATSVQDLMQRHTTPQAPLLLDLRRRPAFEGAARLAAGARWYDPAEIETWIGTLPTERDLLVYCAHGEQVSQAAAARLRTSGRRARFLIGGFDAYLAAGGASIAKAALPAAWHKGPTRWVTRARPKIDRLACPWLIRRFIDPQAQIYYVESDWVKEAAVELDAVPFDVPGVTFSHRGAACSFDAFIADFEIQAPGLAELAAMVRGADTAQPDLSPQAQGLLAVSLGLGQIYPNDLELLEQAMTLYDALYAWQRFARTETHSWTPEQAA